MRNFQFLICISLFIFSCNSNQNTDTSEYKEWEMNEIFYDQTPELLGEGNYCPFYYREDSKLTDSLEIEGDNSVIAIAAQPEIKTGKTKALVWINDTKQELTLLSDNTTGTQKYTRVFENENFRVKVDMKIVEVIDGMGEGDMLRYSGKMIVQNLKTKEEKDFKIQGGC